MGLFASKIEKDLENIYVPLFISNGLSRKESVNIVKILLKKAKIDATSEGTTNIPNNYGDILVREYKNNIGHTKQMVDKLKDEGVTENDIRWWWNLNDLERRMMILVEDNFRITSWLNRIKEGMGKEEAAAEVRKNNVNYGDPDDTSTSNGYDRPLPDELRDRINRYIKQEPYANPITFKEEINKFPSFNALIRAKIKNGKI